MWRLALPLVLLLGVLPPSLAHACSCAFGTEVFPKDGTVPPNVTFLVRTIGSEQLLLLDEKGTQVPLSQEEIGFRLTRLRPSAPLEEGRRYMLEIDRGPQRAKEYGKYPIARYQVLGEPDMRPPRPPDSADFDYEHGMAMMWSSCEAETEGYTLRASGAADDRASSAQLAIAVVSSQAPDRVLALLPPGQAFMGKGVCLYNFDIQTQRGAEVRLRSVDLAGNLSQPGPTIKLFQGMPLVFAMLLLSTPGRVLLTLVVLTLIGLVMLVVRRSSR